MSDEQILELLFESLGVLSLNAELFGVEDSCAGCLESYKEEVENEILKRLIYVAEKFLELEDSGLYSRLSSLEVAKDFVDFWHQRYEGKFLTLLTLNYDGVVDTLFGRKPGGGFFMRDFFRSCDASTRERLLGTCPRFVEYASELSIKDKWRGIGYCFDPSAVFESIKDGESLLLHLHGSYKYWRTSKGEEIKLDKSAIPTFQRVFS